MDYVAPRSNLLAQIAPFMTEGKRSRPSFPVESALRIHFMQQWFTLSDRLDALRSRSPIHPIHVQPTQVALRASYRRLACQ
jgi:hypothetical protein